MKTKTLLLAFVVILMTSCSPSKASTPDETKSSATSAVTHLAISLALTPTEPFTVTPPPEKTPLPTQTPTSLPWKPLEKDLSLGDWYFRCQVTAVSFDIIEILPKVDATGFLVCDRYKIPAGIYNRNDNSLYYWGLLPIKNPNILDHLGERGVERFLTVFELGETYLDVNNLIGKDIVMSVNLPNSKNRAVFDTQNIGRFAGEYWGDQSAVDLFAQTGVLSNDDNILYPISLGVAK